MCLGTGLRCKGLGNRAALTKKCLLPQPCHGDPLLLWRVIRRTSLQHRHCNRFLGTVEHQRSRAGHKCRPRGSSRSSLSWSIRTTARHRPTPPPPPLGPPGRWFTSKRLIARSRRVRTPQLSPKQHTQARTTVSRIGLKMAAGSLPHYSFVPFKARCKAPFTPSVRSLKGCRKRAIISRW